MDKIPVCALVTIKNEEKNIARCLMALQDFAQIIVIDSHSGDKSCEIAKGLGADVVLYEWDGKYPKKRQWCLNNLDISYDWVFWVDADEVVTSDLIYEIRLLFTTERGEVGFFVKGRYIWNDKILKYGLCNNKIALFNHHKMCFPIVNDLDISGMGEIEGHYQPIMVDGFQGEAIIGQVSASLLHYAYDDKERWLARHKLYAHWEAEMTRRSIWPEDPVLWREKCKKTLRKSIFRPYIVFLYSYFVKLGFLDGAQGYDFAISRKKYCTMILNA